MACEIQYQQYLKTRSSSDQQIYQSCLSRSDKTASADRAHASREADANRKAALYSQIHNTSAMLAQNNQSSAAPNYMSMLQSGSQYQEPTGPGGLSKAASGLGSGILIFGILAGGMVMMMLMFYMVKPKTVQSMGGYRPKKKSRKKAKSRSK